MIKRVLILFCLFGGFACKSKKNEKAENRAKFDKVVDSLKTKYSTTNTVASFVSGYSIDTDSLLNKYLLIEQPIISDIYKKDSGLYCRMGVYSHILTVSITDTQLATIKNGFNFVMIVQINSIKKLALETQATSDGTDISIYLTSSDIFIDSGKLVEIINLEK